MKKPVSAISFILFMGVVAISTQSCNSGTTDNSSSEKETLVENKETGEVKAYYFHATRRCATCQTVEDVSKEAIKEYYGDKVTFESINRDEDKDNPLMTKYKVNGQTLLIVNGNREVDLTNDAFLNARSNPDKFKSKLKSTIDSLM
jgi:hypothetical protein